MIFHDIALEIMTLRQIVIIKVIIKISRDIMHDSMSDNHDFSYKITANIMTFQT